MGRHRIRYRNNLMAWNSSGDPEWQFRKTLDKKERDAFDAKPEDERNLIVQEWQLTRVGFKF